MKLTKLIFLFALTIAAVGCNKDDDGPEPYKLDATNFVDTYKLNFLEEKVSETVTFNNGTTSTSSTTTKGTIFQDVNFVFNADGTFDVSGLYTAVKTIKNPDGSTETNDPEIYDASEKIGSGTYSLNTVNGVVTLSFEDEEGNVSRVEEFDITKYTETEMRIFSESTATSGNSTTTTTVEYRFSR